MLSKQIFVQRISLINSSRGSTKFLTYFTKITAHSAPLSSFAIYKTVFLPAVVYIISSMKRNILLKIWWECSVTLLKYTSQQYQQRSLALIGKHLYPLKNVGLSRIIIIFISPMHRVACYWYNALWKCVVKSVKMIPLSNRLSPLRPDVWQASPAEDHWYFIISAWKSSLP